MNWYKTSQDKINLLDIYDEYELNDSSEAISEFISPRDISKQFSIKILNPNELKQLKTHIGESTVYETYLQFATEEQKQIVQQKMKNYDNNRIVVIANQTLLDGYHQVVASILLNKPQKCIDIYEEEKQASIKIAKRNPLDILARDITNKILEQIKDGNFIGRIREDLPDIVYSVEWRLRSSELKDKIAVTGGFYPDTQEINLYIWVPEEITAIPPKFYEAAYYDVFQAIRHELEHAQQTRKEEISPGQYQDLRSNIGRYMYNSINNFSKYLLIKHETEAFVRGFVTLAKKLNRPVEDIMRERLWLGFKRFIDQAPVEEKQEVTLIISKKIDEIINEWMNYAKTVFNQTKASINGTHKTALPLTDQINMHGYMGIGHRGEPENNILWFIDNNYYLHTISESELAKETRTETKNMHDYWGEFQSYNRRNAVYAKGRYGIDQNKASLNLVKHVIYEGALDYGSATRKLDYATKKIVNILDRAFSNPSIQVF